MVAATEMAFIDNVFYLGKKGMSLDVPEDLEDKTKWVEQNVRPVFSCYVNYVRMSEQYRNNVAFREDFESWNSLYEDTLWFFEPKEIFSDATGVLARYNLIQ